MRAISVVKGSAPVMATTADPATNRLGAWGYDLNGNATSLPGATTLNLTYDAANRVIHAADGGSVDEWYAYAANNKRMWKRIGTTGVPVVTFWGIDGTRMGEFTVETRTPQGGSLTLALVRASTPPLTFAGKRIMTEDRLGSVNGSYYPYGQPKSGQTGAGERFATYYKDGTGLEYAQKRYYSSTWGRFTTPDPYIASGGPIEPGSWNRYEYVRADPIRFHDPAGLLESAPESAPGAWTNCGDNWLWDASLSGPCPENGGWGSWGGGGGGPGGGGGVGFQPSSVPACPYPIPLCGVWNGGRVLFFVLSMAWDAWENLRLARTVPTVEEIERYCTPVGDPVIVPATRRGNRDGGQSIEQEYVCPDGRHWTTHTLVDKYGKILEKHIRSEGPQYGPRSTP